MATITVKFYGLWRLYLGMEALSLEANDLDAVMESLESSYGDRLRAKIGGQGIRVSGHLRDLSTILVNGVSARNLKTTLLADGDVVHVFPPIAGG